LKHLSRQKTALQYDEGIWLSLQGRRASMHVILTRAEAEQLLANLQLVLAKEVA
jgi:hypothetical protein